MQDSSSVDPDNKTNKILQDVLKRTGKNCVSFYKLSVLECKYLAKRPLKILQVTQDLLFRYPLRTGTPRPVS
jgi:hypothetical protein